MGSSKSKVSQAEAQYKPGKPEHHCGPISELDRHFCRFFEGNRVKVMDTCKRVSGLINPSYGCKLFEKQTRKK